MEAKAEVEPALYSLLSGLSESIHKEEGGHVGGIEV